METTKPKLIVFSPLYPPHIGGLESHAQTFNHGLRQRGYTILTLTPLTSAGGNTQNRHVLRFPAWEIIPNFHMPAFWRPAFWRQILRAKQAQPQLIITRTRFFVTSLLGTLMAQLWNVPHLHIEHGSDYVQLNHPLFRYLAKLYDQTLGRFVLKQAHFLVANSEASADFIHQLSGRQDITVIYRGIDHQTINKILAHPRPPLTEPTLLTYLGRLIDGKGLPDLFHAITNLNVHLWLIGDGPQKNELLKLAQKLNIQHRVTFHGEKPFKIAISLLKATDILVHPSHTEGLPTSVIEAALCHKPIIATVVGGTTEIITHQHSGLLVPPRRPDKIKQALEDLLTHPSLAQKLAANAYHSVSQRFNWKNSLDQYEKIFRQLA
jgi:glycosyltransferase involved in cell wall biosynthesis